MRRDKFLFNLLSSLAVILMLCVMATTIGCKATKSKADTFDATIQASAAHADASVSSAQEHVTAADKHVLAATSQPSQEHLKAAHVELQAATKDLAPVHKDVADIKDTSTKAATLTKQAVEQRDAERDHYVGYKARRILWILGFLVVAGAVTTLVVTTNGGAPVLGAITQVLGSIWKPIWAFLKWAATWLFHIVTLGAAKFGRLINKHYDAQNPPAPK